MSLGQGLALREMSSTLLDGIVAHFAANTTSGDLPLPARRYVVAGDVTQVSWDCEQLVVGLAGIGWGTAPDTAMGSQKAGIGVFSRGVRHAVYSVQLVRCTPTPGEDGEPPSAERLMAAGLRFQRDAGLLSQALVEIGARVEAGLSLGAQVQAGAIQPLGPQGDHVGMEGEFIVTTMELS